MKEAKFDEEAVSIYDRVDAVFSPYQTTLNTKMPRRMVEKPVHESDEEDGEDATKGEEKGEERVEMKAEEEVGRRMSSRVRVKAKPDGIYSAAQVMFQGGLVDKEPYRGGSLTKRPEAEEFFSAQRSEGDEEEETSGFQLRDSEWRVYSVTDQAYAFHVKKKDPRVAEADSKELEGLLKLGSIQIMNKKDCPKGIRRLKTWLMRKEKQSVPVDKAANAGGSPQEADVSMQEEFERAAKESGGAASGEQTIVKSRLIIGGHMAEKQPARLTH